MQMEEWVRKDAHAGQEVGMHFLCSYTKHKLKDKTVETSSQPQWHSSEHLWGQEQWGLGYCMRHTPSRPGLTSLQYERVGRV